MLYCPNHVCQTPNPEFNRFCQNCRAPIPRVYLWGTGGNVAAIAPGELLSNRYLCKGPQIFLDTKPGLPPTLLTDLPAAAVPYLRLIPHRLHVPQLYEVILLAEPGKSILLLDEAALNGADPALNEGNPLTAGQDVLVTVLPALSERWPSATALRQLYWLWQMAGLWNSLGNEQVEATLLTPAVLRVDGPLIRLLELVPTSTERIPLAELGRVWSEWANQSRPEIANAVLQLCQQMQQGQVQTTDQVIAYLDGLMAQVAQSQSLQLQLATRSDQGPSRQRNEDACYPPAGTIALLPPQASSVKATAPLMALPMVMVCDGIGGHQGGDVASHMAIHTLQNSIQSLDWPHLSSVELMTELGKAVALANDAISDRNDSEQRYERQRMGTTVVMAIVRGHELYMTHVGDSRAYWITRHRCRQMTLDDDLAAREVRLGFNTYRQALMQPSAGSLIQALGMGASHGLHPTVQRFILDEDCVILLCSDGLSDNDRVETFWDIFLLPLLEGRADIGTVGQQLIDLSNSANGHDNATIALLQVQVGAGAGSRRPAMSDPIMVPPTVQPEPASTKTQMIPVRKAGPSVMRLLGGILLLGAGAGILTYALSLSFRQWIDSRLNPASSPSPSLMPSPSPVSTASPAPPSPSPVPLLPGNFIQIAGTGANALLLQPISAIAGQPAPPPSELIPGSIVQVMNTRGTNPGDRWVQIRICSVAINPSPPSELEPDDELETDDPAVVSSPPAPRTLQPGDVGLVPEQQLLPLAIPKTSLTGLERGACARTNTPTTPIPPPPDPALSS